MNVKQILWYVQSWLSRGKDNQSFIGATWVVTLLKLAPKRFKRRLALTLLSWSPHYFSRHFSDEYARLPCRDFLDREFKRSIESRETMTRLILSSYLNPHQTVLDYGCGAGFFARAVSPRVARLFAVDVSLGVLECARILNSQENTTYLHTSELGKIGDGTLDLVYSFAVIQHVTDQVFEQILDTSWQKLKDNGRIVFHVVVDQQQVASESAWVSDKSLRGRVRLKYGLNLFGRNRDDVARLLGKHDFSSICFQPIEELCPEGFDDICRQHLVTAVRSTRPSDTQAAG